MRLKKPILLVALVLGLWPGRAAADRTLDKADEQTLQAAGIGVDGPALLAFFHKHTLTPIERTKLEKLVGQLNDDNFELREKATKDLKARGSPAAPLLRRALQDPEVEVVRRAQQILKAIDTGPNQLVFSAAARLLAARHPEGSGAALLGFLPFAEEGVQDDVRSALASVAVRDGKPDPILVEALKAKSPTRRAAAAAALCRANAPGLDAQLRAGLKDTAPEVRLGVALAFFARKDKESVPVLIALLTELPRNEVWRVEEVLYQVAGDRAPSLSTDEEASPVKFRQAWTTWWKEQGPRVDLAKVQERPVLGYTVVALKSVGSGNGGKVVELGRDGKQRWQLEVIYPLDVQVLSSNRVLVAENSANRVTERDLKGKLLWEKQITLPVSCQRLRNGNTLMASSSQIIEVDRNGRNVFRYQMPAKGSNERIVAARKLRNGQIIYLTNPGAVTRLDAAGKVLKTFPTGKVSYFASTFDLLPRGRILIPCYMDNKVIEYDADGKSVWQATVVNPVSAVRLPNGNTLVACPVARKLVEVNRAGKEVGQTSLDGQPRQARRR